MIGFFKFQAYKSSLPNCVQVHRRMQVSWEIFGPQITIQLAGFVGKYCGGPIMPKGTSRIEGA